MFQKILIANRGEIAVRVIRACREMGIASMAVFSEVDRASLHVRLADEAYEIGPAAARESYLRIEKLMDVARRAQCDALHPGYGFLAENPALPRACGEHGIAFIGPSAEAMERLGAKTSGRQIAKRANVPTVPGTLDPIEQIEDARRIAAEYGFPILLKAVAGGGGKGMRLVNSASEFDSAWRDAGSEAFNAFGDSRLYIEKYLVEPRHIEIQIFGDQHGNVIALGERECSVQRRHQKVIEESPSPVMDDSLRRAMCRAAVSLAREAGYSNAGTVEFLVDASRKFYFLEVNTRLQVEHPVTECVTGLDLVKMQIRAAAGEPLSFAWQELRPRGHSIECRIYAEDPANNFFPSPGRITSLRVPSGPGVRVDEGVYEGCTIPMDYDPLLAKLVVWAENRGEAIARMHRALDEYFVGGIKTNINFLREILSDQQFTRSEFHTRWLDDRIARRVPPAADDRALDEAVLIAALAFHADHKSSPQPIAAPAPPANRARAERRRELLDRVPER